MEDLKVLNLGFKMSQYLNQGMALIGQMMFLQRPNTQTVQNNLKLTYLLEEKYFGQVYKDIFSYSESFLEKATDTSRDELIFKMDLTKAISKMSFILNTTEPVTLGTYFETTPVKELFDNWSIPIDRNLLDETDFDPVTQSYYYLVLIFVVILLTLFVLRIS
jgi:hypothetical protein